jgi:hypothetical protein
MEDQRILVIRDDQLQALANLIVTKLQNTSNNFDRYMTIEEVMKVLNIHSRSTIQDIRNRSEITFFKLNNKNILYDRESVEAYIQRHAIKKF